MAIQSIDPRTGDVLETFHELTGDEVEQRLAKAHETWQAYRHTSFDERSAWLHRAADLLDEDRTGAAEMMTTEIGKTRPGPDGRQRRRPQARVQRAAVRGVSRGGVPTGRLSRRCVPGAADRLRGRRVRAPRPEGLGRHRDRERRGRPGGGVDGR